MTPLRGSWMRDWRKRHNYTQERLADDLGVKRQTISIWENAPKLERIVYLALTALEANRKNSLEQWLQSDSIVPTSVINNGARSLVQDKAPETDGTYLAAVQVAEIYEASTFALQDIWAPFNILFTLVWERQPEVSDEDLVKNASVFAYQVQSRLKAWSADPTVDLHRIVLQRREQDGSLSTMIIGHAPPALIERLEAWLLGQQASGRWRARMRVEPQFPKGAHDEVLAHWGLVRKLWASANPASRCGGMALLDRLCVPVADRLPAGDIACRRYSASFSLGPRARYEREQEGFRHMSAMRFEAWDWLFTGWEYDEYLWRRKALGGQPADKTSLARRRDRKPPWAR